MSQPFPVVAIVLVVGALATGAAWSYWRPAPIRMEVLLADWRRRWVVRRQISAGVRRLQRLLPGHSANVALLVVEWLPASKRADCLPLRRRGERAPSQLITVALTCGERRQTVDELLAAVTEQYLALAAPPRSARPAATVAPPPPTPDRLRALLTDLGGQEHAAG